MLVQLETQLIWYGRELSPGDTVDLPEAEARRFIERGMAIPVVEQPIETATITPPENAALRGKQNGRTPTARRQ